MDSKEPDKQRNIRIDDDLYEAAKKKAKEKRLTFSGLVRQLLLEYLDKHK